MLRNKILEWMDTIDWQGELKEYVKIPSVSANREGIENAKEFAQELLKKGGLKPQAIETSGNPVIIANNEGSGKSILIYGHYDVQPPGDLRLWQYPPFEPRISEGKLWGRGSADNKGQHYAHLLALRYLKEEMPEIHEGLNIKFILDGDEERGSFTMKNVLEKNRRKLESDLIIVSDGPALHMRRPTIVGSVRGILGFQITIDFGQDLHSGNFGGIGRSAVLEIVKLLNSMVEQNGRCKVEGFYDDVGEPSEIELEFLNDLEEIYKEIIQGRGIVAAPYIDGKDNKYLNQMYPTFNINGLQAGGVDENRRTIIPGIAKASVDCRLVPNMDSETIKGKIQNHVMNWAEENGITKYVKVKFEASMEPVQSSLISPHLEIIKQGLEEGFEKPAILVPRLGGSLPIYLFPKILGSPTFLVPYALPDENNHAPNENLDIEYFKNGVIASIMVMKNLWEKSDR